MSEKTDHPFQPGVAVAIVSGYENSGFKRTTVEKAYKNGNFVLADETYKGQQWSPRKWYHDGTWRGEKVLGKGESYRSRFSPTIQIINEAFEEEWREKGKALALRRRANTALDKVRVMRPEHLSQEEIEILERFVTATETRKKI